MCFSDREFQDKENQETNLWGPYFGDDEVPLDKSRRLCFKIQEISPKDLQPSLQSMGKEGLQELQTVGLGKSKLPMLWNFMKKNESNFEG